MATDLRFKLNDLQRIEIKKLWDSGFKNYTQLGAMFGVHAKTIRKVIYPEYKEECNEFNRLNWRRHQPSKAHHAELMRNYRRRKKLSS